MNLPVFLTIVFPDPQPVKGHGVVALLPVVIAATCFVLGCLIGWLLNALRRSKKKKLSPRSKERPVTDNMLANTYKADAALEQRNSDLEWKLRQSEAENETLRRQLAENEQFARARSRPLAPVSDPPKEQAVSFYFLQPSVDGCFGESARVTTAADGLYELSVRRDSPSDALVTFINTPENVALALQNEPTWILVACERSNIPTPYTRSVKTEVPGIAVLRNGEWKVQQKAKISYA